MRFDACAGSPHRDRLPLGFRLELGFVGDDHGCRLDVEANSAGHDLRNENRAMSRRELSIMVAERLVWVGRKGPAVGVTLTRYVYGSCC